MLGYSARGKLACHMAVVGFVCLVRGMGKLARRPVSFSPGRRILFGSALFRAMCEPRRRFALWVWYVFLSLGFSSAERGSPLRRLSAAL